MRYGETDLGRGSVILEPITDTGNRVLPGRNKSRAYATHINTRSTDNCTWRAQGERKNRDVETETGIEHEEGS